MGRRTGWEMVSPDATPLATANGSSAPALPIPASSPAGAAAAAAASSSSPTDHRTEPAAWRGELMTIARWVCDWAMRPRVRLTLTGTLLLTIGALVLSSSVWTLPLVIVGALMVAIAWIGHRLDGRFVIEWGEAGTELAFRATIKAAHPGHGAPTRISSQPERPTLEPESRPDPAEVIDAEAHTVEIDISELKALIAAAESQDAEAGPVVVGRPRDIQIRRAVSNGAVRSEASR